LEAAVTTRRWIARWTALVPGQRKVMRGGSGLQAAN